MVSMLHSSGKRSDGWWLAALSLAVYLILAQRTFYDVDGEHILFVQYRGNQHDSDRFLYPFFLDGATLLLRPFAFTQYEIARSVSAIGTSLGVLCTHFLCLRVGLSRQDAIFGTALTAFSPAWMFFATVLDVHGPFLPFAAAGIFALIWVVERPTSKRAFVAGLAVGLTFLAHPTGVLLITILPFLVLLRRRPGTQPSPDAAAFSWARHATLLVLGAAIAIALPPLFTDRAGDMVGPSRPVKQLLDDPFLLFNLTNWGETLARELLLPYAPICVVVPFMLLHRSARTVTVWLLLSIATYLSVCVLVTKFGGEEGAYLLPLAWPMALLVLTVHRVNRGIAIVLVLASLALGTSRILHHDNPQATEEYATGFRAIAGDRPILVLGDRNDLAVYFLHLHDLPLFYLPEVLLTPNPTTAAELVANIDRQMRSYSNENRRVFLSKEAIRSLRNAARDGVWSSTTEHFVGRPHGPRALLEYFEREYEVVPVQSRGFEGVELQPRR